MSNIVNLYKNKGETPLQALTRLKRSMPEYNNQPLTYAGRLDPMAEGTLIVLAGEENKQKEQYLNLPKEYIVDMVFGIQTDTYDILGKIVSMNEIPIVTLPDFKKYVETFMQEYPPYSSQPVLGKPLFQWAREGRISEIVIPRKQVTIFSCELIETSEILPERLLKDVIHCISLLKGDFRQKEIMDIWKRNLNSGTHQKKFKTAKIRVGCSSGTYMRSLVERLGKDLGSGALAFNIMRTKVGEYSVENSLKL
ncbi:MAG: hypothetical protein M3Q63_03290 [bacterium]|nr:hypothetical protein [bacterium]